MEKLTYYCFSCRVSLKKPSLKERWQGGEDEEKDVSSYSMILLGRVGTGN